MKGLELSQAIRELIGFVCVYSISQTHELSGAKNMNIGSKTGSTPKTAEREGRWSISK